jgi:hypothetical protein
MLGPVLLARADFLLPSARHTGVVIACAGAAIVLGATWRALVHDGVARWLVFLSGGAPGLVCVVMGLGGPLRGLVGMGAIGLGVAALQLATSRTPRPRDDDEGREPVAGPLQRIPEILGGLLASMERWVVGAAADAVAAFARLAAWVVAAADEHVVATPADRAADGVLRVAHGAEAVVGGSLARVVWAAIALAGVAAFLHALWPGG